ncbi:hypothetical protein [Maridesulfovibrio salexigens]|uniref:Uncharacterized protein n=1 Tax=Maridesulfovibrio salexigens (strain ATCC 14822 / DSM 2638 / NCIMB 8403 / VKM B-1763) TaxID=526222 RepID=C6BRM7_MARSD|nr:hypothetical protein [Maridesulfovibrio salexigens]ACS79467.1 hypothetical protein Desal_1405 [Maridesulfovibrio salexigens DSM 2638]
MTTDSGFLEDEQLEAEKVREEHLRINEQFLSDVRATFNTSHGKRVFTFLLEQGGVNALLFSKESDIYRNVAVHDFVVENVLGPVISADEEIYLSIIRERAEQMRKEEEERK